MHREQGLKFKIYSINNAEQITKKLIANIYIKFL